MAQCVQRESADQRWRKSSDSMSTVPTVRAKADLHQVEHVGIWQPDKYWVSNTFWLLTIFLLKYNHDYTCSKSRITQQSKKSALWLLPTLTENFCNAFSVKCKPRTYGNDNVSQRVNHTKQEINNCGLQYSVGPAEQSKICSLWNNCNISENAKITWKR